MRQKSLGVKNIRRRSFDRRLPGRSATSGSIFDNNHDCFGLLASRARLGAPNRRMTATSLGKRPTTSVRRLISPFRRSIGFVLCRLARWAAGKLIWASTSLSASSISVASWGATDRRPCAIGLLQLRRRPAQRRSSCTRCGATAPSMSASQRRAKPTSPRGSKIASFSARTHDAATRKDFADDHAKRDRLLSKRTPRKRMRTGAPRTEARSLPVAVHPEHAGMPVAQARESDGKTRRDGSDVAWLLQPKDDSSPSQRGAAIVASTFARRLS
jgi:hypothetical protein